jgi:hypothetical protein
MSIVQTLKMLSLFSEQTFFQALKNQNHLAAASLLASFPWIEVEDAINDLQQQSSSRPLLEEEFDKLTRAATKGAPAVPGSQPGTPPLFEVIQGDVRRVPGPRNGLSFRITPISRLRMVMVQKGYQRMDPQQGAIVSVAFQHGTETWYPGVELYGEGIFIDLPDAPLALAGPRFQAWLSKQPNPPQARSHPVHVWWHTLSHRLLQSLSIHSGYSSAAIRERVYLHLDASGTAQGGILLYTVQPGGDGTLGGLIAQAERFGSVLNAALRELAICSNDPLCEDATSAGAEGAACYSCLLASETSCEHRNLGLDRLLLLENLP